MAVTLQTERLRALSSVAQRQLHGLRSEARHAEAQRESARQAAGRRSCLNEANSAFVSVDVQRGTLYSIVLLGLLAVYFLDVVLFAPVAEFFVARNFSSAPSFAHAARFLLPASILLLEIVVCSQLGVAYGRYLDGVGHWMAIAWWVALSVLLAVVIPATVVATYMAAEKKFSPWISGPLVVGLAGLSLVSHLSVLFGGRLAADAKSYWVFRARDYQLARKVTVREGQRAADLYADYYRTRERYNQQSPDAPMAAGPFDKATRSVVNEVYGYEAITVGSPASAPVAGPPVPADWGNAGEGGWHENDREVRV
jgi:hypothetical protein